MAISKDCKYDNCKVSTGIHDGLTFGTGDLDVYGYWEFPCSPCARAHEKNRPEDGACWPFTYHDGEICESLACKCRE